MSDSNQNSQAGDDTASSQTFFVDGAAGKLETVVDEPGGRSPRGIAVIAHPHPLFGGTMDNKVVYILFKALLEQGFIAAKFNFRGVGRSEGKHEPDDNGAGEIEDVLAVVRAVQQQFSSRFDGPAPLVLAGFSFGGAIQAFAAEKLKPQSMVMVAPAVARLNAPPVAYPRYKAGREVTPRILIVHGDQDDVVPLNSVLEWAAPQELPVVVIPGAEHFFHRRLHILKSVVTDFYRS